MSEPETITVAGGRIVGAKVYGVKPDGTRGDLLGTTNEDGEVSVNAAKWEEYGRRVEVDLVVTSHHRTRAELPEVLHEDVDERVVVVDDEDGRRVRHGR